MPLANSNFIPMKNAFVSGVSSGIGFNLAQQLLEQGYRVYGVSRRAPAQLMSHPHFHFCQIDYTKLQTATSGLASFIATEKAADLTDLSLLFLNVGQFGKRIAPLTKIALADLEELMRVNVWSHKLLLDCLLEQGIKIDNVVFSSSIAGVRARAGNSGYALTKATLNMLAKLYALENPTIHFLSLGLCTVDTFLSDTVNVLPLEGDFPDIVKLRERGQQAGYLTSASQRASDMLTLLHSGKVNDIPSGDFVEIRALLSQS